MHERVNHPPARLIAVLALIGLSPVTFGGAIFSTNFPFGDRRYNLSVDREFIDAGGAWDPADLDGVALKHAIEVAREKLKTMKLPDAEKLELAGVILRGAPKDCVVLVKFSNAKNHTMSIALNASFQAVTPTPE
jgi:hypothetical protein